MIESNPHSVFKKPEDYYNWDKYLEQLKLIELSDSERTRATYAIRFLRELFGETFLKKCFYSRHPFYAEFANSAPMARLRLIRFAESIQAVANASGFNQIVTRLKNAKQHDEFQEASTVVETANKFQKTGFIVIFEPDVKITTTQGIKRIKNPDLKLINPKNQEEIFVEVSRLRESDKQIIAGNSFNTIWFLIHQIMDDSLIIEDNKERNEQIHRHILPYVNILQHLDKDNLEEIIPKILALAQKVNETNEFQELIVTDKIEVAISPIHDHSKVKEWAQKRNIKDLVKSLPIPLHETHRARVKIGNKIRQLPIDKPGIIIIPTHETLLLFAYPLPLIVDELKSEIEQYPQLRYVVLSLQAGESPKEPATNSLDEHLFIKKMREDFITETNVLINNSAFNLLISESTVKQINQAFIENY